MTDALIKYIEGLGSRLRDDYADAHEKLSALDAHDQAEKDSLLRHVDEVAGRMAIRRMDVMNHVVRALSYVPPIEERHTPPPLEERRAINNANGMFDVLYQPRVN